MRHLWRHVSKLMIAVKIAVSDFFRFCAALFRSRTSLAAENLFLGKQLSFSKNARRKPKQPVPGDRLVFSKLARLFEWRNALVIVKPATLIGWHRAAFRRFWRWKSRPPGRPPVSAEVRRLIRRMAIENPTWGEERIADELWLKLQIHLSPRTVGKYLKSLQQRGGSQDQRWSTFVRNHAQGIVACDFLCLHHGQLPDPLGVHCS